MNQLKASRLKPVAYGAMYSSWSGGIVTDPALMVVPVDDHLVHRGDGVFEAFRTAYGAFYDLQAHLTRLENSAAQIGLALPGSRHEILDICRATFKASGFTDAIMRLFVSRGPGSFTPNPYESSSSQLYVIATAFAAPPEVKYDSGVRAMISQIRQKPSPYSQIKSCNYLPNVMMKKESVDSQVDYAICLNDDGVICEGPTENIFMLSAQGDLLVPKFDYTLRGTTLNAALELAERHLKLDLRGIQFADIRPAEIFAAKEVFMAGTTIGVLPVVEISGHLIGGGVPGPIARRLRELLTADMQSNKNRRTIL